MDIINPAIMARAAATEAFSGFFRLFVWRSYQ
jgi:hypothetical protein